MSLVCFCRQCNRFISFSGIFFSTHSCEKGQVAIILEYTHIIYERCLYQLNWRINSYATKHETALSCSRQMMSPRCYRNREFMASSNATGNNVVGDTRTKCPNNCTCTSSIRRKRDQRRYQSLLRANIQRADEGSMREADRRGREGDGHVTSSHMNMSLVCWHDVALKYTESRTLSRHSRFSARRNVAVTSYLSLRSHFRSIISLRAIY